MEEPGLPWEFDSRWIDVAGRIWLIDFKGLANWMSGSRDPC